MRWATREIVHFDRVATPWLILRFVDADAEFILLPWGKEDERPADAVPFGIPDVELATHDREATTFGRVMTRYGLDNDPALGRLAKIVRYAVNMLIFNEPPPGSRIGRITEGVLATIEGIMVSSANDHEVINRALTVFDGLYALCNVEVTMEERNDAAPGGVSDGMWLATFITAAMFQARKQGRGVEGGKAIVANEEFEALLANVRGGLSALNEEWN